MATIARIAHLGTGLLGGAMAERAIERGDTVSVWNRTASRAKALEAKGARLAATIEDAVKGASRVHLCLSDDVAVDAVLADVARAVGKDVLVVDHTTTSPDGTKARCDRMVAAGVQYLHAPVFMSPAMAREAKGMMLASGPRDLFERAKPALEAMTGDLWFVGERVDLAAAYKLFGNMILLVTAGGVADCFAIARGVGLEPADALTVFQRFKPGVEPRGSRMAKGDFTPSFELTMARKDLRLGLEAAERSGLPLAVLPALAKRMDDVIAAGRGAEDYGVIAADAVAPTRRDGGNSDGDPIAQLESSHRKLEQRMAELARTPGDDQAREDFLGFVERSVRRHEEDEEESLFPRLAHVVELRGPIATLRDEHRAHAALHRALRDAKDEAGAADALELLRRAYAKHVQLEESVLFPGARLALDRGAMADVMREMQARRGRGPGGGGGGGGGGRRNR